jgi:ankyrin repeat protein
VITLLLDHKCDMEVQDQFGNTPLGDAAENNQLDVMTLLLERGADKNHQNKDGDTPYKIAYKAENHEAEDLLWDKSMLKGLRIRNESKDDTIKTEYLTTPDPLQLDVGLGAVQPILTMKRQNVEFFPSFKSPEFGKPTGQLPHDTPVAQDNAS